MYSKMEKENPTSIHSEGDSSTSRPGLNSKVSTVLIFEIIFRVKGFKKVETDAISSLNSSHDSGRTYFNF